MWRISRENHQSWRLYSLLLTPPGPPMSQCAAQAVTTPLLSGLNTNTSGLIWRPCLTWLSGIRYCCQAPVLVTRLGVDFAFPNKKNKNIKNPHQNWYGHANTVTLTKSFIHLLRLWWRFIPILLLMLIGISMRSIPLSGIVPNTGWPVKRNTHILGFYTQITRSSH